MLGGGYVATLCTILVTFLQIKILEDKVKRIKIMLKTFLKGTKLASEVIASILETLQDNGYEDYK